MALYTSNVVILPRSTKQLFPITIQALCCTLCIRIIKAFLLFALLTTLFSLALALALSLVFSLSLVCSSSFLLLSWMMPSFQSNNTLAHTDHRLTYGKWFVALVNPAFIHIHVDILYIHLQAASRHCGKFIKRVKMIPKRRRFISYIEVDKFSFAEYCMFHGNNKCTCFNFIVLFACILPHSHRLSHIFFWLEYTHTHRNQGTRISHKN